MEDRKLDAMRRLAEDSPFEGERAAARAALARLAAKVPLDEPGPYVPHPWDRFRQPEVVDWAATIRVVDVYGVTWTVSVTEAAAAVVRGGARGRRSAVGSRAHTYRQDFSRQRNP